MFNWARLLTVVVVSICWPCYWTKRSSLPALLFGPVFGLSVLFLLLLLSSVALRLFRFICRI